MYFNSEQEFRNVLYKLDLKEVNEKDLCDSADHGDLVARIVTKLADEMGLDENTKELLHNAAILHDVGKLKLSDGIYGRDKKSLHVEEVRRMRMHAKLGADMLHKCEYDNDLVEAVYHHHESFDGSGYPDNLRAEQIPYTARFLKVCDVFAALVSDRPYRHAFDKETALSMMIEDNKDYDMEIFLKFMNLTNEESFDEIMQLADEINKKHSYHE